MEIAPKATRAALRRRGIRTVIPERANQIAYRTSKGRTGGQPPGFDRRRYRDHNVVERAFNRLKQWRDIATRYDKRATIYRASLVLIAALTRLT